MSVCDYYRHMSNDASEAWTLLFRLFVSQRGRVPQVAAEFDLSPMQAHVLRLHTIGEMAAALAHELSHVALGHQEAVERPDGRQVPLKSLATVERTVAPTVIEHDGRKIGVFNCEGALYAIEDRCSHDDGPLAEGEFDEATCTVECPRHGSVFELRTGKPVNLPAYVPVDTFPVSVWRIGGLGIAVPSIPKVRWRASGNSRSNSKRSSMRSWLPSHM